MYVSSVYLHVRRNVLQTQTPSVLDDIISTLLYRNIWNNSTNIRLSYISNRYTVDNECTSITGENCRMTVSQTKSIQCDVRKTFDRCDVGK